MTRTKTTTTAAIGRVAAVLALSASAGCLHMGFGVEAHTTIGDGGGAVAETDSAPQAAGYAVPAQQPRGNVYVTSFGGEWLQAEGGPAPFLHVRIAAQNDGDTAAWTVDSREQVATIGGDALAPSYAQAQGGGSLLTVAPRARGFLDVYFRLPASADPPALQISWVVRRGGDVLAADTTPFQRASEPQADYVYYRPTVHVGTYLGPGPAWWWYDDYWLWGPRFWWWHPYPYYGRVYYGGYYGGGYYGGGRGRGYAPPARGGGWRGGGAPARPSSPPPASGGGSGKSDWRKR